MVFPKNHRLLMRLGFHYHIPATLIDDKICTTSYLGLFLDGLAAHFEHVVVFLHSPRADELPQMDYALMAENITLAPLAAHLSVPRRLLTGKRTARKIAQDIRAFQIDLLLLRAPTPLLPLIVDATIGVCQHALLVVGDMRDHLQNLRQPWWRKGFVRRYIHWNEERQEQLARSMLVFTNSAIFYERYKPIAQRVSLVRTTTLSKTDFFERTTFTVRKPIKVLYTGRIEAGKGLLLIAAAVVGLIQQGIDCQWDIVGWSEPGDDTDLQIQAIFNRAGLQEKVVFHGKKKAGEALFDYYRKADVFVIASLLAEGFPRTIWEALANALPVIATPVGSIPYYLKHEENALLVQPEVGDIMAKIRLLYDHPDLCKTLAYNGLITARESTIAVQSKKMAQEIKDYAQIA
jgi:glycosyltransferase involved in cell wall biosynthesis